VTQAGDKGLFACVSSENEDSRSFSEAEDPSDLLLPERDIETALLIRELEESLLGLYAAGKIAGTVHTCSGQEWIGVAVGRVLEPGDRAVSNHRGHGHYLGWTRDADGLIAEIMGRATGICRGMGGSQHLCAQGFFSNGILGGMAPVAAGMAFALGLAPGSRNIVVLFLGDGAMAEGVVYEALNIAASFALPLYVVCEHNGIAQSTPVDTVLAGSLDDRAAAFGIATRRSATWRVHDLLTEVAAAVAQVRLDRRPLFHLIDTFRLNAHSKGDDTRPAALIAAHGERDPTNRLIRSGHPTVLAARARARASVHAAIDAAERAPPAATGAVAPLVLREPAGLTVWVPRPGRVVERINQGLRDALARDRSVLLLGEDIEAPYGGAFKVTRGLSAEFPGRVRNMPISEAAIIGAGSGLALSGFRPCVEIMFGDFLTLGFDQLLNHAAMFGFMYGGQVEVPLVVRTPMGGGRGYGPTHSQTLDRHFLGIPGLAVVSVNHRIDLAAQYAGTITMGRGPVLILENKRAYQLDGADGVVEGFDYLCGAGPWPTLVVRPRGAAEVTILCHGGMLAEAEGALDTLFSAHEVVGELVCPARLQPLELAPAVQSLAGTGRLLVVEEGIGFASFGAEVIAALAEQGALPPRVRRLAAAPHPVPAAIGAERAQLPGRDAIVRAVLELLG
jgi:2-oxoisovalerate dehydrogenase E1 component